MPQFRKSLYHTLPAIKKFPHTVNMYTCDINSFVQGFTNYLEYTSIFTHPTKAT